MSEILKVKVQDENGNVFYIHTSADVVFCADGTSVQDRLGQKLDKSVIIQNATTAATDKVPSAAVAKDLQDQITQQNTNFEDVTDKFNWGTAIDYKAVRVGKVVFFRATCTTKNAMAMNFATTKDNALNPFIFTPLTAYTIAGADFTKRAVAYVQDRNITVTVYESYASAKTVAPTGNVAVAGSWIIK